MKGYVGRNMDEEKNKKEIMLRITPQRYAELIEVAKQAAVPVTTLCRLIIFDALDRGVTIQMQPSVVVGGRNNEIRQAYPSPNK